MQVGNNTDEELCNRWMQLSAFMPFCRNHNTYGATPQEPYRWTSVAYASRIAIAARYALLPYWVSMQRPSPDHNIDYDREVHTLCQCIYGWSFACEGIILRV